MSLSQVPAQDDIVTQLKTIEGVEVYIGQYIPDSTVPEKDATTGYFLPYITIGFGTSFEGSERGILSTRNNTLLTNCTVFVTAPDDRISRLIQDQVRDKLIGFAPTDATPLVMQGGFNYADTDMGYTRYVYSSVFRFQTNITI